MLIPRLVAVPQGRRDPWGREGTPDDEDRLDPRDAQETRVVLAVPAFQAPLGSAVRLDRWACRAQGGPKAMRGSPAPRELPGFRELAFRGQRGRRVRQGAFRPRNTVAMSLGSASRTVSGRRTRFTRLGTWLARATTTSRQRHTSAATCGAVAPVRTCNAALPAACCDERTTLLTVGWRDEHETWL